MSENTPSENTPRFARVLKSWDVLVLSFGAMIGWSWVMLSGYWVASAGSLGAALAFLIGGGVIALIGLVYAELAAAMPLAGGEHVYTHRALGPGASFVCSWAILMAYVVMCVFESTALPTAVEYLVPAIRFKPLWEVQGSPVNLGFVLVGLSGAIFITWINVRGIKTAAFVQSVMTLIIFLGGLLLMAGAISFGDVGKATPWFANGPAGIMVVLIMVPALMVGFDVIPQSMEEIDLPPARVGSLLVFSVFVAVAWYSLITLSVAVGIGGTTGDSLATADAASVLWGGGWAGQALVLGGVGGLLTSWNAFLIGASRLMYALSESEVLPPVFARLHPRYRTPYVGIITIGVLSCISPLFGRNILVWLVNASSFAILVGYLLVAIAFVALRRKEPDMPRPFKVPAGMLIGAAAVAATVLLLNIYLPWSPSGLAWPQEWIIVLVWCVLGVAAFARWSGLRQAERQEAGQGAFAEGAESAD